MIDSKVQIASKSLTPQDRNDPQDSSNPQDGLAPALFEPVCFELTDDLQIRTAQPQDIESIFVNEQAAYPFGWSRQLLLDCIERAKLEGDYEVWLMSKGEWIIGHMVLLKVLDEIQLLNVCVIPDMQGQGLGKSWISFLLNRAQTLHMNSILLEVRESNRPAIGLYEKSQFRFIGKRKDYYPADSGREDAIVMKYTIRDTD